MRLRPIFLALLSLSIVPMLVVCIRAADEITFEEGIEYSNPDNQHLQLNLATPKQAEAKLPAVICIHGGGFRAGDRKDYNGLCKKLAARGYVAATVTYRLSPKFQFPGAVFDCKAAVRWMKANAEKYHIDPERIGVLGGSAGGHLAEFLGVTGDVPRFEGPRSPGDPSSRVACVVNYYGPSDFTKSYGKSVDAAVVLPMWLGGDLKQAYHQHVLASPLNWVTPDAAPSLLLHGTLDQYVAFEQAVWMRDRLKACDVEVKLVPLEGAKHGFGGKDAERAEKEAFEFLDAHLKKTSANAAEKATAEK
ncbi:MAG TPA: alpha/beta hydrolase [Pirellulales bacterium]|jgi:acetyl esterase/lipase|nr:alpha/beta hydrolase [Pirellulales bacterium]